MLWNRRVQKSVPRANSKSNRIVNLPNCRPEDKLVKAQKQSAHSPVNNLWDWHKMSWNEEVIRKSLEKPFTKPLTVNNQADDNKRTKTKNVVISNERGQWINILPWIVWRPICTVFECHTAKYVSFNCHTAIYANKLYKVIVYEYWQIIELINDWILSQTARSRDLFDRKWKVKDHWERYLACPFLLVFLKPVFWSNLKWMILVNFNHPLVRLTNTQIVDQDGKSKESKK